MAQILLLFSFVANSMNSSAETKLQTILSRIAVARGFNAVEGLILGALLLHPQPRTQRNIAAVVGRSQSTISRALHRMIERGVVEWNRKTGSREMLFTLASESPRGLILSGLLRWLSTNSILRNELEALVGDEETKLNINVKSVAQEMIDTIDYVSQVLKPVLSALDTTKP